MHIILIKYGELTTKKGNRNLFINILENNIRSILKDLDYKLEKHRSRMFIYTNDPEEVIDRLKNVFGIFEIDLCYKADKTLDDALDKSLKLIKDQKTFKVNTKRSDKTYPMHSMDFSSKLGGLILKNTNLKVDVHNPDIIINAEIRKDAVYIYSNKIKGLGGYPVGVQGKGLLMLSGGIDSPVSGYLAMKRGVNVECLYFDAPPHTSLNAKNKVKELANIINKYSGKVKLHVVPFTKIEEEIYKKCQNDYMITIMRRMMYRIAERYAKKINAKVIINGESIGQVASQTLTSMSVINEVTNMPIIRPVACLDKLEIIKIAKDINTYETSILPYEDCCTVFVPKHPVINPSLEVCKKEEQKLDYEQMIDEAVNNIEIIEDLTPDKFDEIL